MIDFEQTAAFLAALTRSDDGWITPVTFQTFDDSPAKDLRLARILHGTLRQHVSALPALNERGAGVFATIQQTDGRGRREANIIALRACFIDCDRPRRRRFVLRPSLAVKTPHGGHAYWLLEPGANRARFREIQQQLAAYFGSDPAVSDLARVMRLPGTLHRKDSPTLVHLVSARPQLRYTIDALAAAHPVPRCATNRLRIRPSMRADYNGWAAGLHVTMGRRNSTAFAIAAEGFARGLAFSEVAKVVETYCLRADITDEAPAVVASAYTSVKRRR